MAQGTNLEMGKKGAGKGTERAVKEGKRKEKKMMLRLERKERKEEKEATISHLPFLTSLVRIHSDPKNAFFDCSQLWNGPSGSN